MSRDKTARRGWSAALLGAAAGARCLRGPWSG
jgi:hypothetical protein